jgi:endonuclease/exonuclease/phosphatase family metal-dependent hydrolase
MFARRLAVVSSFLAAAFAARSEARARNLLKVVTINVAGLPEGMSRSRPVKNLPLIGERLNQYDLAFVQEDFAYPSLLRSRLRLAHQSKPFVRGNRFDFGDGLSLFSRRSFPEPVRTAWTTCHGMTDSFFDCLTPKGFTKTTLELAPGAPLDVVNVHLDAGWSPNDKRARAAQFEQLSRTLGSASADRAVIVAGDFNLSPAELALLDELDRNAGLRDACRALSCREPRRVDRVFHRSSSALVLVPVAWRVDPSFVDEEGRPLSDHAAVAVAFRWERVRSSR